MKIKEYIEKILISDKLPIKGLLLAYCANDRNRWLHRAAGKFLGETNYKRIKYLSVFMSFFIDRNKYNKLVEHILSKI